MKIPELLLPAGSLEHLRYAFDYGADAVYAGQPRYSLRARNNSFQFKQLQEGMDYAKSIGKKLFIASNVLPHNSKVKTYIKDMQPIMELKPDALIMADPGLIMMVKETWPDTVIHLSVQANTVNFAGVKFWQKIGISRIILSRELSLDEIEEIRQECPDIELEVFVHGALCIAYSGRCLLSGYFNHRDPNQGTCTNACRWQYEVHKGVINNDNGDVERYAQAGHVKRHHEASDAYLVEDVTKPGELMPIYEDEHGTYIMNSKDLRAIEHVERLVKIGVDSLKVEGRTKSIYYVARVAQTYRQAIDDAVNNRPFNPSLFASLEGLANRGYTDGFLKRHHAPDYQNYVDNHSKSRLSQYVGVIVDVDDDGFGLIEVKNKFGIGDRLEIITPSGIKEVVINQLFDQNNKSITVAQGSGVWVKIANMNGFKGMLLARVL